MTRRPLHRRDLLRWGLAFGLLAGCTPKDPGFGGGGTGTDAPDTTGGGDGGGSSSTDTADTGDTGEADDDDRYFVSFEDCPELEEDGGYCVISNAGLSIVIVNDGGSFHGVLGLCTYDACSTSFDSANHTCPCCGSTFEPDGTLVKGPASSDLADVEVDATSDGVYVDVSSIS